MAAEIDRYLNGLHLEDLALACACAAGAGHAWDHFVLTFRPVLYRAADAIDPGGSARDLADALYADLYGLDARGRERHSLFRYFHGRSSLATWLRAVLAQRLVDARRASRRLAPMPETEIAEPTHAPRMHDIDSRHLLTLLKTTLRSVFAQMPARDRVRLACYYVKDLTLAAIGKQLGEHEATVSRHLTRTRREIRDQVERRLRDEHGLDAAAIEGCWRVSADDPGDLDIGAMMGLSRKESSVDRSKTKEGV
jgi:RNA polymerase sigma factor (sigma-70 family)